MNASTRRLQAGLAVGAPDGEVDKARSLAHGYRNLDNDGLRVLLPFRYPHPTRPHRGTLSRFGGGDPDLPGLPLHPACPRAVTTSQPREGPRRRRTAAACAAHLPLSRWPAWGAAQSFGATTCVVPATATGPRMDLPSSHLISGAQPRGTGRSAVLSVGLLLQCGADWDTVLTPRFRSRSPLNAARAVCTAVSGTS